MNENLVELIAVTAELCGTQISKPAAKLLAEELAEYDSGAVSKALQKCRRELKGRLTMQEVISRIDDGRPGPEEAWATLEWDERATVVLTDEMSMAQGVAFPLYDSDPVAARMAFKEAYIKRVAEARAERIPIRWFPSLGYDKAGREEPIRRAIDEGKLRCSEVQHLIPDADPRSKRIEAKKEKLQHISAALAAFAPRESEE